MPGHLASVAHRRVARSGQCHHLVYSRSFIAVRTAAERKRETGPPQLQTSWRTPARATGSPYLVGNRPFPATTLFRVSSYEPSQSSAHPSCDVPELFFIEAGLFPHKNGSARRTAGDSSAAANAACGQTKICRPASGASVGESFMATDHKRVLELLLHAVPNSQGFIASRISGRVRGAFRWRRRLP